MLYEMCSLQYTINILYDFCRNYSLFASVGFKIDGVTTQLRYTKIGRNVF